MVAYCIGPHRRATLMDTILMFIHHMATSNHQSIRPLVSQTTSQSGQSVRPLVSQATSQSGRTQLRPDRGAQRSEPGSIEPEGAKHK